MFVFVVILCFIIKGCLPLAMVKVSVPLFRVRGEIAQLECNYILGSDTLYSVKWYKDNEEFYRYMPKFDPPKHAYRLEGIKVDLQNSDEHIVTLQDVTLKTSGLYRCEVSAEAPSFASAAGEGRMDIIHLPQEGLKITGNEVENKNGEIIILNCTSGRSFPAAVLSWFINDEKVTDPALLIYYPPAIHPQGLISTTLGLRVPPDNQKAQVRCTARVSPSWKEGREAVVGGDHMADNKEAMLLVRSSSKAPALSVTLLTLSLGLLLGAQKQLVT